MRIRARLAAVAAAVTTLAVVPIAPAAATSPAAFTRVRLTVTSSSDWTTVSLLGVSTLDRATVSAPADATLVEGSRGFSLRVAQPSGDAVAVVDEVLEVPSTARPIVHIGKGYIGDVHVVVERTNAEATTIATVDAGPGTKAGDAIDQPLDRAALVGESLSIAPVDARRLVLAFYYPWFRSGSFDGGLWYDRPSGPYATDDPAAVAAMVDQARSAGINGFIVSWNGSSTTAARYDLLADTVATRPGFVLAPYLELAEIQEASGGATDVDAIVAAASSALERSASASYLDVDGRPVLFVYGTWTLTPPQWQAVMSDLAASGWHPFVVGDGSDPGFGFDGFHLYNPNGMEPSDLRSYDWSAARRLRIPHVLHPEIPQQLWAATVSPGQNNVARKGPGTYRPRDDGLRYDKTWSAALASNPDWVLITSWNEWLETTEIQPAQNAGRRALDQTTLWSARFQS